ncbi:response regulator [Tatlockia micdadei]|nr:response regulator [Legionella micdadei]
MPNNVYWLDRNCITQGCNENVLKFVGLKNLDDFIGITYEEMGKIAGWHEGHAAIYKRDDMEVMATGIPKLNIEDPPLHDNDGNPIYYLSSRVPIFDDDNKVIGVVGISVDITNRKKIEAELKEAKNAAEAANQAKTEFLENMRHDIRTPLTGIVGFSEIIKLEFEDPRIQEYADNLIASSHALLHLLDEVLEAIRVSSGEIPKLRKKFDLHETLEYVIALNRAKAAEKNLNLSLEIDPIIPRYLIGDKIRLHRIALELIANALNFTDSGFVKLSARLAKRNSRELILKLIVQDTGIGIHKDRQQDIYVQFKRLTPSYQGIYKGAGLGLSVIKQFIDDLGAEIYLESEPRKGSIFTCLIPLQEALLDDSSGIDYALDKMLEKPYETTYLNPTPTKSLGQHQTHILVVEDNAIAQKAANSILNRLSCTADIAINGHKAIEFYKNKSYDLILMDIGLPDLDGYEVTRRIRVHELVTNTHTPIIALTAHAGDENKKRCIEAGMNAVITKPLTAKSCVDILDAFIPGHHQPEAPSEKERYLSELPEDKDNLFNLIEFPILDIEEGIKATGNESALADMLKFMITDSLPKDFALMKEAHEAHDWDKTQQLAHKIKGGAVYVGTMKIKMACQFLERYWKTGQRDLLEQLYRQTVSVIEESMLEISHWLESH